MLYMESRNTTTAIKKQKLMVKWLLTDEYDAADPVLDAKQVTPVAAAEDEPEYRVERIDTEHDAVELQESSVCICPS